MTLKPSEETIGPKSIEWAAGLYEGEGSLCPKYKDPKKQWKLTVKMTDYDVVKTFHDTLQVGKLYGPLRPPSLASHHKTCWEVRVTNTKDILKVIYDFYPYMGERRRAKFDEFLTHHYGN